MSRKTAAERNDKMDALIMAINRLAESQKESTETMAKALELHRQSHELNVKQYALNVDNHQYNREQAESNLKNEVDELTNAIKEYVDGNIRAITAANNKNMDYIKAAIEAKADKVDEKNRLKKYIKDYIASPKRP